MLDETHGFVKSHGREWNAVSVILVDDIIDIVNQNSICLRSWHRLK
jgi:hypothetical protein